MDLSMLKYKIASIYSQHIISIKKSTAYLFICKSAAVVKVQKSGTYLCLSKNCPIHYQH